jgi:cytidylate kinase
MYDFEVMDKYIIALDGVSGSGKSSTAKKVAEILDILYLDTGAMYRAVTFSCQKNDISFTEAEKVVRLTETLQFDFSEKGNILVNNEDLSAAIRKPEVSQQVSDYCSIPDVRKLLVNIQREIGSSRSSVLEGRDIGTVVFPDARFKFFLWGTPEVRAQRRIRELKQQGITAGYQEVLDNLLERDEKDTTRKHGPLIKADDAEFIDTTNLRFEDQVRIIVDKVTLTCAEIDQS